MVKDMIEGLVKASPFFHKKVYLYVFNIVKNVIQYKKFLFVSVLGTDK